ncbi:cyclic AMP-responsive element-binding protein 3-like protein 3-B isoform X2 [Mugil cephalus]|uniref:cyclic AMP-responsive element-binding protein 3-like protein 3-B isoform X2 n=1 Tax=Mugil cephalus TaxID=48193 RepID=UPI001FB61FA1|nr:cyclic AMP-responsive element-binding protein 3-like protein 3-B isoform X2 [Mugil cephalus]
MTLTTDKFQGNGGMDIIDLLHNTDESISCRSNQPWTITINDTLTTNTSGADDFLDALLQGSDSSSVPASPLWSPCTTDSGINEDPLSESTDSPHQTPCTAFPAFNIQAFPQLPSLDYQPPANEKKPDISIDLGWESGGFQEEFEFAYYLSPNQNSLLPSNHSLSVKDLLLSNVGQKAQQDPQLSLQELVLNEDEKKLLAKEGVNLPSKLPLSKFEERVLKKIRRKIRNKRSAQESRKKKREYVDSLEGRMSACSSHNLELQRKVHQLEETNSALLEQLSRLQALLPNSSRKTTHRGACILPDPYSQGSRAEYAETKVPSRSLQSMGGERDATPAPLRLPLLSASRGFEALRSLTEKLWTRTDFPAVHWPPSQSQDHRHKDDH